MAKGNAARVNLPDWLEKKRVPDAEFAAAYEKTPAKARGALKTGIALAHCHFGRQKASQRLELSDPWLGFCSVCSSEPAPWACLFFGSRNPAPARVCAAAILPVLAGVKQIFAICTEKPEPGLLTSLELCGTGDLFQCDQEEARDLLAYLGQTAPGGRLFLQGELADLGKLAAATGIICFQDSKKPALLLTDCAAFDSGLLEFCQGQAPETTETARSFWDCVYADSGQAPGIKARLRLGSGLEGFWLYENLGPDFYLSQSASFGLLMQDS